MGILSRKKPASLGKELKVLDNLAEVKKLTNQVITTNHELDIKKENYGLALTNLSNKEDEQAGSTSLAKPILVNKGPSTNYENNSETSANGELRFSLLQSINKLNTVRSGQPAHLSSSSIQGNSNNNNCNNTNA